MLLFGEGTNLGSGSHLGTWKRTGEIMNLCQLSEDEMLITDGKKVLLFMSRGDKLEVEGSSIEFFMECACEGCNGTEYAKRQGELCEGCTVGDEIPQ